MTFFLSFLHLLPGWRFGIRLHPEGVSENQTLALNRWRRQTRSVPLVTMRPPAHPELSYFRTLFHDITLSSAF